MVLRANLILITSLGAALGGCGAGAQHLAAATAPAAVTATTSPISGATGSSAATGTPKPPRPAAPGRRTASAPTAGRGAASLTRAPSLSGARQEVSGKVGSTPDPLPAAANAPVAAGAPSDAQIRKELAQVRKAGVVPPAGDSAQSFAQGATFVGTPSGAWAFPIQPLSAALGPSTWTLDQGVDVATGRGACGAAATLVAIASGQVVQVGISGFGPAAPVVRIDRGPWAGWYVYYGHSFPAYVRVGQHVNAGQPVAAVGCGIVGLSSGPHLEIGLTPPGPSPCCAAWGVTSPSVGSLMAQLYSRSQALSH